MAFDSLIEACVAEIEKVLLGKNRQIRLALCCLISRGHLLLEDLPGMGKTTLAHALAAVFGLQYRRVQFTSDLLPADILGVSIFDPQTRAFSFHPGPIFTQVLLADEINRSSPRTQSALLEAMGERQVTVEGETRPLPEPFFVIATQNPLTQYGTYPLPESQLDRFTMRLRLGYPGAAAERALLANGGSASPESCRTVIDTAQLSALNARSRTVHTSGAVLDYVQRLLRQSRQNSEITVGLSPRAALTLLDCARTWAMMSGREHVLPEDVQTVLPAVAGHRIVTATGGEGDPDTVVQRLLSEVDVLAA